MSLVGQSVSKKPLDKASLKAAMRSPTPTHSLDEKDVQDKPSAKISMIDKELGERGKRNASDNLGTCMNTLRSSLHGQHCLVVRTSHRRVTL